MTHTAADNVGVDHVDFFIDGAFLNTEHGAPYACVVDTTQYPNGNHTLRATAFDAAGNNASASITVSVQNSSPPPPPPPPPPPGAAVYVAQTQAGTGDGSSCMNAFSASFFNNAANWGSTATISPGKTVALCGTITSTLTARANGTSGSPITIAFSAGAKLSQPVCGPCLNLNGRSFIDVDGGPSGIIESNNNGTLKTNHSNSTLVNAGPCNNCEIKNLTLQNAYVIAPGDSFICASGARWITVARVASRIPGTTG